MVGFHQNDDDPEDFFPSRLWLNVSTFTCSWAIAPEMQIGLSCLWGGATQIKLLSL